jgi:uncharacterized protein (DUF736 family)
MPVIGTFSPVEDGYVGSITTLTLGAEVSILRNRRKEGANAPDFRIMLGPTEIGAAWRRSNQNSDKTYLRVKLDDPALPQPIWGALLEAGEDGLARLLWQRDRKDEHG